MKQHITERNYYKLEDGKTLCGRTHNYFMTAYWFNIVETKQNDSFFRERFRESNWCKVCKMIFNSEVKPSSRLK